MDYIIREMRSEEYCLLSDFLYEAIYIPEGIEPPPKSVIECPELQEYIVEFGNRKHDKALVVEMQGNVIGAIWVRIMNDYGHIDNDTPSLAMSVYKKYRGLGIGTSLLKQLLQVERLAGYSKISLSVQKSNYAVKMYEKVGFTVADLWLDPPVSQLFLQTGPFVLLFHCRHCFQIGQYIPLKE